MTQLVSKAKRRKRLWVFSMAAIASGLNPSRQNYKQEAMRSHLVDCFNTKKFSMQIISNVRYLCTHKITISIAK